MGIGFGRRKSKGTTAERDLIHKFWAAGWAAVRVAGSGSSQFPSSDLLAGNSTRKFAIEAKATADNNKYFTEQEIRELAYFSSKFGAHPLLAIKFDNRGWFFLNIDDLKKTDKNYVASFKIAELYGLKFEELISE